MHSYSSLIFRHFVSASRTIIRRPMSSSRINLLRLVSASVYAASQAAKVVRDVMKGGNLGIVDKGINDLQTEADRWAQRIILSCISQNFPTVTIIGEETLSDEDTTEKPDAKLDEDVLKHKCPPEWTSLEDNRIVVWVDPLDGTSEYTQGFVDHVTVLIGISVDGRAVAGVICQPFGKFVSSSEVMGRMIWAIVGLGVFGIEKAEAPKDQLIITTTRSHGSPEIYASIEALKPNQVLRVGGAGNKVLLVIEGKAHVYLFPSAGCKKWDTCGPEAVLRANGGILTDIHGNDIRYDKNVEHLNSTGVLAAVDRQVFDKCLQLIPPEVKHKLIPKHCL